MSGANAVPAPSIARALDGADVDEDVLGPALGLDEPITLVGIEEFYGACSRHGIPV